MATAVLRLIGIDIGGTRSRARLWADGQIAAEREGPSASIPAAGADAAKAALDALLAGLDLDPAHPVDAICAGSAGLSVPGAQEFLREQLAPVTRSGLVVIVSDAALVLPAAGLDEGIAVICGTGSVAMGTFRERAVQAGGWGYLLGDEGGGYWIVREALRTLLWRREQGRPAGELGREMLSATASVDIAALQRRYYGQPHVPGDWARLARFVLESGDPAAADITGRAADAAAALAAETARLLDPPGRFPVVLAGGLMAHASFRHAVADRVTRMSSRADVRVLEDAPVAGAIRLAGKAAGQASGLR
ncbi:MAG TPA: BadF/BadG/BcrA/BcrD ATPase family protein [Streptosporangiaceae bacterium]|jgi:N-acetylglucosamine kinase-like BadF-type ATPase